MRVLVAGAGGAIGVPLTRRLIEHGHEVYGLTRSPGRSRTLADRGVRPLVADAMDRDGLLRAVDGLAADAVIHELTALTRTPILRVAAPYAATFALDTNLRVSTAKARDELGWRPAYPTYRDGMAALTRG